MKETIFQAISIYNTVRNRLLNKLNSPIIVLMYHRILDKNTTISPLSVSKENFIQQITYLKENYNIVGLNDDWSTLKGPSFVITFDDGYYDNYLIAKDFLNKNDIPATFFITTQNINTSNLFWWDEVSLYKDIYKKYSSLSFQEIFQKLIRLPPKEQEIFLKQYHPYYPVKNNYSVDDYRSMTEKELYNLSQLEHMTIGAHTVNHPRLSILTDSKVSIEIIDSKKYIEKLIKTKVTSFSYPYGNYNKKASKVCKKTGFTRVVTTSSKNAYAWTNPMKIPRIQIENDTIDCFKHKIEELIR